MEPGGLTPGKPGALSRLKLSQDGRRQWAVKVVGNGERPCGQSEGAGRSMGHGNWPEFRDWAAFADHKDVLPGLYAVEHRGGVVGKFSKADSAHNCILSMVEGAGKRQNEGSPQV